MSTKTFELQAWFPRKRGSFLDTLNLCFLKFPMRVAIVISGEQIRAARERAGLTQNELGQMVGVSMRTVGNWERGESVSRNREAAIRSVLAGHLPGGAPSEEPLREVSDAELLAEIARRFSRNHDTQYDNVHQLRRRSYSSYGLAADDHSQDPIGFDDDPHET